MSDDTKTPRVRRKRGSTIAVSLRKLWEETGWVRVADAPAGGEIVEDAQVATVYMIAKDQDAKHAVLHLFAILLSCGTQYQEDKRGGLEAEDVQQDLSERYYLLEGEPRARLRHSLRIAVGAEDAYVAFFQRSAEQVRRKREGAPPKRGARQESQGTTHHSSTTARRETSKPGAIALLIGGGSYDTEDRYAEGGAAPSTAMSRSGLPKYEAGGSGGHTLARSVRAGAFGEEWIAYPCRPSHKWEVTASAGRTDDGPYSLGVR